MYKANFDDSKFTCKSPHHYSNIVDYFYTVIVTAPTVRIMQNVR